MVKNLPISYLEFPLGGNPQAINFWEPLLNRYHVYLDKWRQHDWKLGSWISLIDKLNGVILDSDKDKMRSKLEDLGGFTSKLAFMKLNHSHRGVCSTVIDLIWKHSIPRKVKLLFWCLAY